MADPSHRMLPYRLSICGLDDLAGFAARSVSHVISILDVDWPEPIAFAAYAPHWRVTLRFDDVMQPCPGVIPPQASHVEQLLAVGNTLQGQPVTHLLIHCHEGISRSAAAAAILMAQRNPGQERRIFTTLAALRPCSWPNRLMIELADEQLDRRGALLAALDAHYGQAAPWHPACSGSLEGLDSCRPARGRPA